MNGPQHLTAAGAALAKAESESGPRGDLAQFNKHMRLHAAHLAMAQFALDVARTASSGHLDATLYPTRADESQSCADALSENAAAWIAAITRDGAK